MSSFGGESLHFQMRTKSMWSPKEMNVFGRMIRFKAVEDFRTPRRFLDFKRALPPLIR